MLNVGVIPHRHFFPADSAEQKLFLLLKLRPTREVSDSRPPTSFSFVIDTSGSMDEVVVRGKTKRAIVIESLLEIARSNRLTDNDRVSLIRFDDRASTLLNLTAGTKTGDIEKAIEHLNDFSGGTRMGLAMKEALSLLDNGEMTNRRVLIFTDGETFDEWDCRNLSEQFARCGIPITALGVGDEYNEDLLLDISDKTSGHRYHIGHQIAIDKLPETLFEEVQQAQKEVINNLALTVKTVKGVELVRLTRIYPDQAELDIKQDPYPIGAAQSNDDTIFVLEFNLDARPVSRMRIARLGLTYDVPGLNKRGELTPQDVIIEFIQGAAAQINPEVMNYVQQRNVSHLINEATRVVDQNPEQAQKLLEAAKSMTLKIGNQEIIGLIDQGIDEVRKTRKISDGTRKTVKMGAKGKTVKMDSDDIDQYLSEENIRKLSGT
ncbi:MAG: hypothetical protein N5P05_002670 [Chroococcopsis gigantea SAG 12.99]|jgi:Ca-activated chloride channel family protein|nr:VWA domain-containing protein [Chlorogloea purpurea SAG 13.99]MDV3001064.1 hypothetical protein [Chroococcopsis gigantea SAG 12.99]